jgi:hypothetical protein
MYFRMRDLTTTPERYATYLALCIRGNEELVSAPLQLKRTQATVLCRRRNSSINYPWNWNQTFTLVIKHVEDGNSAIQATGFLFPIEAGFFSLERVQTSAPALTLAYSMGIRCSSQGKTDVTWSRQFMTFVYVKDFTHINLHYFTALYSN